MCFRKSHCANMRHIVETVVVVYWNHLALVIMVSLLFLWGLERKQLRESIFISMISDLQGQKWWVHRFIALMPKSRATQSKLVLVSIFISIFPLSCIFHICLTFFMVWWFLVKTSAPISVSNHKFLCLSEPGFFLIQVLFGMDNKCKPLICIRNVRFCFYIIVFHYYSANGNTDMQTGYISKKNTWVFHLVAWGTTWEWWRWIN